MVIKYKQIWYNGATVHQVALVLTSRSLSNRAIANFTSLDVSYLTDALIGQKPLTTFAPLGEQ